MEMARNPADAIIFAPLRHARRIDRDQFEAILRGDDPEEVFRVADQAKSRKAAEHARAKRQRQREQQEGPAPEGLAPGGVASFVEYNED